MISIHRATVPGNLDDYFVSSAHLVTLLTAFHMVLSRSLKAVAESCGRRLKSAAQVMPLSERMNCDIVPERLPVWNQLRFFASELSQKDHPKP